MTDSFLPYSCPLLDDDDRNAVAKSLESSMISQGEVLKAFEQSFAAKVEADHAVAFSSGTAALHGMCLAAGFQEGDEVIVPALTFAGTSNAVLYTGGVPVFVDVHPDTLCISPEAVKAAITPRTRAILGVDFAGRPQDYAALGELAFQNDLMLLADAAHAPGAFAGSQRVGAIADMTAFSFNPVKNMTAGEGGMVTTSDSESYHLLLEARAHGMTRNPDRLRSEAPAGWYYEMHSLGYNYKLSEMHAALGLSQLKKLDRYNNRRREIAGWYDEALSDLPLVLPTPQGEGGVYHLYPVRLARARVGRDDLFRSMREVGLGVQLHYIPVPEHPFYRERGYTLEACPVTRAYYETALSIPLHPGMDLADQERVRDALVTALC